MSAGTGVHEDTGEEESKVVVPQEIERKWLVWDDAAECAVLFARAGYVLQETREMSQAYIAVDRDFKSEVRVRQCKRTYQGDRPPTTSYTMTAKCDVAGSGGCVRHEVETPLDAETCAQFAAMAQGRTVTKERQVWRRDDVCVELDVYTGRHAGLRVLEVEFETRAQAKAFIAPPGLDILEVTGHKGLKNSALAKMHASQVVTLLHGLQGRRIDASA